MSFTKGQMQSKPRYEVLDGLRGVAALMVLFFHCFETYIPRIGTQIINHGYLAVDFFFVLSGFVIGYAYDDRWSNGMGTGSFFKRRLIRLHPMVIVGTVFGACLFFFQSCTGFPLISSCQLWKFALCFVLAAFMIPAFPSLDIRGWGEMNSFNGPNWSLTFEYIANILYALILRRLPNAVIAVLCFIAAFFTLDLTLGMDVFGLFDGTKYDVIGGWSLTADQLYVGFSRLMYPFLCGLLISRLLAGKRSASNVSGSPFRPRKGFLWSSLILVIVFSMPQICGKPCLADGIYQAVCILIVFPVVVLLGAGSTVLSTKGRMVCKFLGDISYPLYITHYPLMYMQMKWVWANFDAPLWQHLVVNTGVVGLSIFLAWALLKLYDEPVRRRLSRK